MIPPFLFLVVQQASLYGLSGMFPSKHTQALMTGEGVAGVLVSINRIVTKGLIDDNDSGDLNRPGLRYSTYMYFSISATIICICWGVFEFMKRLPHSQYYMSDLLETSSKVVDDDASTMGIAVSKI